MSRSARPIILPIEVVNTRPEFAADLAGLQRLSFPTLPDEELLDEARYRKHIELFPDGQFTALAKIDQQHWRIVGATSTFRTNFDFDDIQHTFLEAIADGWLTNHHPQGEWLYGADINVHPDFRGMRVASRLYHARQQLAQRLNLRGEIAGGMMPGYHHYADRLTIAQYALQVHQARLHDPTLTVQLRRGFQVRGILYDHIGDPRSHNAAALIVRPNPHYQPPSAVESGKSAQ